MLCRCHPLLSVLASEKLREPDSAHISDGQTPARTARCKAQLKLLPTGRRLVRHPISGHSRSSRPIRVKNPSRITLRTMLSPGFSIVPWPDLNRRPSGCEARDTGFRANRNSRKANQKPKRDGDLAASPCSWFVRRCHAISHRHVNVASTRSRPIGGDNAAIGGHILANCGGQAALPHSQDATPAEARLAGLFRGRGARRSRPRYAAF